LAGIEVLVWEIGSRKMTQELSWCLQMLLLIYGGFWYPCKRIWRGKSFVDNFWLCYFLIVLWGMLVCLIIPGIFFSLGMNEIGNTFPESIGGIPIMIGGWLPAFVGCFAVWLLKKIIENVKKRKDANVEIQNKSD